MRSTLGGHYAGTGMLLAFAEFEDEIQNVPVHVRFPNDSAAANNYADLHGPVIRYSLYTKAEGGAADANI